MKNLIISIITAVFVLVAGVAVAQEEEKDYKKLYLESNLLITRLQIENTVLEQKVALCNSDLSAALRNQYANAVKAAQKVLDDYNKEVLDATVDDALKKAEEEANKNKEEDTN